MQFISAPKFLSSKLEFPKTRIINTPKNRKIRISKDANFVLILSINSRLEFCKNSKRPTHQNSKLTSLFHKITNRYNVIKHWYENSISRAKKKAQIVEKKSPRSSRKFSKKHRKKLINDSGWHFYRGIKKFVENHSRAACAPSSSSLLLGFGLAEQRGMGPRDVEEGGQGRRERKRERERVGRGWLWERDRGL